jgi:hypothetical protein
VSQIKRTPGPWRWFAFGEKSRGPYSQKTIIGSDGQGFADTCGLSEPLDTNNAMLIVAAPDLLEACKAVMEAMEHIEKTDEFPDGVCPADLYTLAYEAIAKAEGRA